MLETKITGDHIILRPLRKADLENRVRWFNDPDVRKTLIVCEQFELEKTTRWFERIQQDDNRVEFVIESAFTEAAVDKTPQKTVIGVIGLTGIDTTHRTAEIYIVIGQKEFWGKGVILEAERLLIDWAFNFLRLEKIWADVLPNNIASIITMKKLGFQIEGTL
jgi:RimJ/RimL family protein N-acetyltransferase